ncbi:MAG: DUF3794 domain-containing protein [Clostridiales bacterium]|jgi:hypothetical protein|nr:DUF3794 domain-containing protein [Clostridiales bacterium]
MANEPAKNELIKEKIMLDLNQGTEQSQILLEGDIIVPDIKPDMAVILQSDAKVVIDKADILSDRVNFSGKMYIQVLYLAKGDGKQVHSMSVVSHIDDFINMDGVTNDMWVEAKPDIQNIDFRMINDRKINYKAILDICVKADSTQVYEVVTDVSGLPKSQQLKSNLTLNKSVSNKSDRFTVKDSIAVPQGKPNIQEILQTNIEVGNQDVRVQNGKINIFGELLVTTLYKGEDDSSIIEFMESELPFNGSIDMPDCKEDMFADVRFSVSDQYIHIRPDDDGEDRIIETEVIISVNCRVSSAVNIEVLEDAYSVNQNLSIAKSAVKYPRLIGRNKNQSTIKEIIQLDDNCPDILQIFRVKGKAVTDEVKVLNDKVVVEGAVDTDILYIAENDDTPLYSYKAMIPFKQIIETKGASPDMAVNLETSVDHVGFNMLSGREVEARFLITFNTGVTKTMETNMITHIDFDDIDRDVIDSMPSMILYVVQSGDTLWCIAKRFNTTVEEIAEINDIDNPDKIYPGQKLLIIKKVWQEA